MGKISTPGYMQGYCQHIENLIERLKEAREKTAPLLKEALIDWANKTQKDAVKNLNRPHWALSQSISNKVTEYQEGKKLWSMVGFRFKEKNPRDPGYYGQYHEAGWVPAPRLKPSAPARFIRDAKQKHEGELDKRVNEILKKKAKEIAGGK